MIGYDQEKQATTSQSEKWADFKAHFGSSPADLLDQWYDLNTTEIPLAWLNAKETTHKGFTMFMIAHFFVWTYPKNARLMQSQFGISLRYLQGDHLWSWVRKVAALKTKMIKWDKRFGSADYMIFCFSVDGVDFRIWERQTNPCFNVNSKL